MCCLVLRSNFALLLTIQFASLFFFSATILSGPYLWNRYSQRLQIGCADWSCGLILHCCLPSNSQVIFHFRGIAPRSHTGRPKTCLVKTTILLYTLTVSPSWGLANNTKETTMTRDPAEFGWHCWRNIAHPPHLPQLTLLRRCHLPLNLQMDTDNIKITSTHTMTIITINPTPNN